ncbi:TadE family protein [Phenylobacterium sp.]|uniref:TadE/TadG family type IV pilus assembly protein n=1 Tax=Phenylobacterium sp. TaxID=1871053 RepID=UPI002DF49DB7|nr:TadE family protein [Phenylobacterium sp.]
MIPAAILRALRRLARRDDGAVLVEYAFVLPVLLLMVFGLMQLGGMAWTKAALNYAVQEAARCAIVRPDLCGNAAQIQAYAASQTTGLSVPASAFTVTNPACGTDVRADYTYNFIVSPYAGPAPTISAEVCRS